MSLPMSSFIPLSMCSCGPVSRRVSLLLLAGGVPGLLLLSVTVQAATPQFWNLGGSGGDGNWSTGPADTNWNTTQGAAGNTTWPGTADDVANFQDAVGGTVTVFGGVNVAGISQNGSAYQLIGGTLVMIAGGGGATPVIRVQAGSNLNIESSLAGTVGLVKSGTGTLTISGLNSYTGSTAVTGGSLVLAAANQLSDTGALTLSGGGSIVLGGGNETVAALVSNGGAVTGAGVLQAQTYQLNDGSVVSSKLGTGLLETAGAVLISGSAAAETVDAGFGTLTLSGGNLSDTAALSLALDGTLNLQGNETVGSFVSNGTIAGTGILSAGSYDLETGTVVSGHLGTGPITSYGMVAISGSTGTGLIDIQSGTLALSGQSAASEVDVSSGTLTLTGNNLSDTALVKVWGILEVNGAETVGALTVNGGGNVGGAEVLTAATYTLENGSMIDGHLGGGQLVSSGVVAIAGSAVADSIQTASGILTNTGTLGHAGSEIEIAADARLVASGTQNYTVLRTSGPGFAFWQGNLSNTGIIRPGDTGAAGALAVTGDFANAAGGTLAFDIGVGADMSDLLAVSGAATLAGTLELRKLGAAEIAALVPVKIIDAGSYSGNFNTLLENLAGSVLFNPLNGTITRLGGAGDASLFAGATLNQSSTFAALYDDVIDPGTGNVAYRPGQVPPFVLSSGIASTDNAELLGARTASIKPQGLNSVLLNRLSPETYAGLGDYAGQATRNHRRSAFDAPALASSAVAAPRDAKDAKAMIVPPPGMGWEVFAAANYFDGETDGSLNGADYELNGAGVLAGVRVSPMRGLRIAAFLAGDDGEIKGSLIDADARGVAAGVIGEWMIEEAHALRLSGGMTFGNHQFEGTRGTVSATANDWSPSFASFDEVDTDTLDLFVGLDAVAWKNERIRIIPGIGLEYRNTSTDGFRELAGGSAIGLAVDGANRDSLGTNFSLGAQADVTRVVMLDGQVGLNLVLDDNPERISARFIGGSRPLAAQTAPLSDEQLYLSTGATWSASDSLRVRLGYRLEFRDDADPLGVVNLGSTFRF